MEDQNARPEFSRGATFEDLIELCSFLNNAGARYVVIGGFAMIHHGYTRGTNDIDLLIDTSAENIEKIKIALLNLPDKAIHEVEPDDIIQYQVVRVADEFVVDLMTKACSISFEQAEEYIEFTEIDGVAIPFLKPEILIQTKDTYRPIDAADRAYLQELLKRKKKNDSKKPWWPW
jgi:hypothetical protein